MQSCFYIWHKTYVLYIKKKLRTAKLSERSLDTRVDDELRVHWKYSLIHLDTHYRASESISLHE